MTYGDFKKQMDAAGVQDTDQILWIDIGLSDSLDISRAVDDHGTIGLTVTD